MYHFPFNVSQGVNCNSTKN